jgi:type VI secretion system protein VasJ
LHLTATPPASGGKTRVPPLPPAVRGRLDKLVENAKWAELIDEAESSLGQSRFCLDLHRYTAQGLGGLGDGHEAARKAVVIEVAGLLRRFPEWPTLAASDGSPLASTLTRAWIEAEAGTGGGGGSSGAAAGANGAPDGARMAEARKLAAGGKLAEALSLSQAAVAGAPTGLARFHTRLEMAELAAAAGQPSMARALFEDLDREMGQRGLESWDPPLAARCLEGLLLVLRQAVKSGGAVPARGGVEPAVVGMIYDRLCRLDPAAVLRLGS